MKFLEKANENKHILFFIIVFAFVLTMANEFFFASERMQNWDQAIYQYIGHLITEGQMPYVDAFDHKGPLLYLIYAAGCLISEKWGAWLINYIFMTAIIGVSFKIAHKFVNSLVSAAVCLIIYSGFITLDFRGGTPEFYAGLFVGLSLYYLADYYKNSDISTKRLFLLGFAGAAIFWLKHSALVTILVFCFFIVIDLLRKKKFRKIFRYFLWYGTGFFCLSGVIGIWILKNHAGMELFEDYFIANIFYAGDISILKRAQSFLYLMSHTSVLFCWIMLVVFLFFKIYKKEKNESEATALGGLLFHGYVAMLITLLFFSMPGRNYYHYLSSLFPLMVFIVAAVLSEILPIENWKGYILGAAGLVLTAVLIVCPNLEQILSACKESWTADKSRQEELSIIEQYTGEKDTIAVLGGSAGQYLKSGHESATTYPYITQAVLFSPERTADYKKQIRNNKPAIIIAEPLYDEYQILGYDILRDYYLCRTIESRKIYVRKDRMKSMELSDSLELIIDLETYLENISQLKDCTVFISVKDTVGNLSEEALNQLKRLGVEQTEKLTDNKRHGFICVVQNGKAVYQNIGDEDQALRYKYFTDGCTVYVESKPFLYGNRASVEIDGDEYAVNRRGWNIVVYNNKSYEVADSAAFDTFDKQNRCYR